MSKKKRKHQDNHKAEEQRNPNEMKQQEAKDKNTPKDEGQENTKEQQNAGSTEDKLKAEIQKEKDNFLRLFAEFENYKKRTNKERIELFSTANKELMTALLPILDDFDRGLKEVEKSADQALLEGMKLIHQKFKNTLQNKGLQEVEVKQGDNFDADIHDAVTQIPAPSEDLQGKIVDVVEKGYKLGDTVIRYPKVVTGK